METSAGIFHLGEAEFKNPDFEQWQEVGFSKLTSTKQELPREFLVW